MAADLNPQETYKLLSGIVVPRPIAWVSTMDSLGTVNLAPFSCYTFVANEPPLIGINIGRKGSHIKDTFLNIEELGQFVVNVGDETMLDDIHASAIEYPHDVSEPELLNLRVIPSHTIQVPRLADVPVSMECKLHSMNPFGDHGSVFVVGEVKTFHFRDGLVVNGKIDTAELRPVCRLGGPNYASLGPIVTKTPITQTPNATTS